MSKLRKILYPLSLIYGEIVGMRNKAFDKGVLSTTSFSTPTVVVGNLNVGGTGKSPQIEYLIRLLKDEYLIAVLSRGYKRKTKEFQIADKNSTASQIGDEPLQFYKKFNDVIVAVDADRVHGINQLSLQEPKPEVVLLDDALQHRQVKPGFVILLTSFGSLYVDDTVLPAGNLREKKEGAKRAQIIIVTKCPSELSEMEQFEISKKLNLELDQTVFFTKIKYHDKVVNGIDEIDISKLKDYKVLLVTGIANPKPLLEFLGKKEIDLKHLKFPDHHDFSTSEIKKIYDEFESIKADKKIILTTEKDYVRNFSDKDKKVYYLEIQTEFIDNGQDFNKIILNYVQKNTGNS